MRKGFIGATQLIGIRNEQFQEITRTLTDQGFCDLEYMFLMTAFQAGIDDFVVCDATGDNRFQVQVFPYKVEYIGEEVNAKYAKLVFNTLVKFLPENWYGDSKYLPVLKLQVFLTDLFIAMEKKYDLIMICGFPGISELNFLPSEIYVPFSNLIRSFQSVSITSPVPQFEIDSVALKRFREILIGDDFAMLSQAHKAFRQGDVPVKQNTERISEISRCIIRSKPKLFKLRQTSIQLLSVAPKIIDTVFGKLPGILAEIGRDLWLDFLKEGQRLVVYNFDPIMKHVVLQDLCRKIEITKDEVIKRKNEVPTHVLEMLEKLSENEILDMEVNFDSLICYSKWKFPDKEIDKEGLLVILLSNAIQLYKQISRINELVNQSQDIILQYAKKVKGTSYAKCSFPYISLSIAKYNEEFYLDQIWSETADRLIFKYKKW